MNSLKKALTKDDVKRYQKKNRNQVGHMTKINQNSITNKNNWTDINQLIQCRGTYKKSIDLAVYEKVKSLLKKSFLNQQLIISSDILVKSLISIFDQYYPQQQFDFSRTNFNHKEQKIVNLFQLLQKIVQQEQQQQKNTQRMLKSNQFLQELKISIQLIKKYLEQQVSNRKNKELNQFDKIISVLKPTKKKQDRKQQKRQNIQKLNKKLLNSLSSGNLHIKVTTQQISIQKDDKKIKQFVILEKKKSQGHLMKVQSDKKIKSPKNQGQIKLQNFFKDPNIKIVKTKVQYDYNAILQGSKTNLQFRNKTVQPDFNQKITPSEVSIKNNFQVTNINKAKKDQGFVFYRPKTNKNQNKDK